MTGQQRGVEVPGSLFATSDLHSSYSENRRIIDEMRRNRVTTWLIVACDVRTFSKIRRRFRYCGGGIEADLDARQSRVVDAP